MFARIADRQPTDVAAAPDKEALYVVVRPANVLDVSYAGCAALPVVLIDYS